MNLRRALESRLVEALAAAGAPPGSPALVTPSSRPEFGDNQANGVMPAAKQIKSNPRRLAEKVAAAADLSDLAECVEVAGPGFLNVRLKGDFLAAQLGKMHAEDGLGTEAARGPQTVVVDYSHPNLAREMHAGHLRSTIIGDAICRTLEFLDHRVIRQNHVGDWGTQFGMLTAYLDEVQAAAKGGAGAVAEAAELEEIEQFYPQAQQAFNTRADFAEKSRDYVVRLQAGDAAVLGSWRRFRQLSLDHCQRIYDRLGVTLKPSDVQGESAYNDDLPKVVADLKSAGLLTESQGARCVFLEEFTGKDGEPLPVIVQKSDGGYLYATTDLAGVRYRVGELKADRILYIVDVRQLLYLRQVFAVARAAGFAPEAVSLEHIAFGTMLGSDGRPFRTREGGTVKLMDLLDEAEQRAFDLVTRKNPDLPEPRRRQIAHAVGIGAVKYADLSQNRTSDYVFFFEKMLSLEGNTAPYMQYASARIRRTFRKAGLGRPPRGQIALADEPERAVGLKLLQFPETVQAVADDCLPNVLCGYLYELAGAFMVFYETCPVLKADEPARTSRLMLSDLTARTIRRGLALLGIETVERM